MALKDKNLSPDLEADEAIAAAIRSRLENELLTCPAAFAVAEELACPPIAVGQTADALSIHLSGCQLGLFGYPGHAKGWEAAGVAALPIPAGLEEALHEAQDEQAQISCLELWRRAERFGVSRMHSGYLAERLGIRVRHCQLGAF